MSFAKGRLLPGNPLIILARQHPSGLFKPLLLNAVAPAVVVGIAIFARKAWFAAFFLIPLDCLLWECLAGHKKEYILTDRRALKHEGVHSVFSFDAPLHKINNAFRRQSFSGRLPKYGEFGGGNGKRTGKRDFRFSFTSSGFQKCRCRSEGVDSPDSRSAGITPRTSDSAPDRRMVLAARSENHHRILAKGKREMFSTRWNHAFKPSRV